MSQLTCVQCGTRLEGRDLFPVEFSVVNLDQTIENLSSLSVEDRLLIVQRLWDTIPAETPVQLSPSQKEELERRIAAYDADPDSALTREELEQRLKSSR